MGKILVVDDSRWAQEAVTEICTSLGHTVCLAGDGKEGLEKYEEFEPDLIITDKQMPVMDGLAFAKEIKKRDPEAAIILYTGWAGFADHSQFIEIVAKDRLRHMENTVREFFKRLELQSRKGTRSAP